MELTGLSTGVGLSPVYFTPHFATSQEKLAYISLNTPTPCPPPIAVPVILPRMWTCGNTRAGKWLARLAPERCERRPASRISCPGGTPGQRSGARRSSYVFTNLDARQYSGWVTCAGEFRTGKFAKTGLRVADPPRWLEIQFQICFG